MSSCSALGHHRGGLRWCHKPGVLSSFHLRPQLVFDFCCLHGNWSWDLFDGSKKDFFVKPIVLCPAKMGGLKEMVRKEVALQACRNLCCLFSLWIPWKNCTGRAQVPIAAQPALSEHPLHLPACTAQPTLTWKGWASLSEASWWIQLAGNPHLTFPFLLPGEACQPNSPVCPWGAALTRGALSPRGASSSGNLIHPAQSIPTPFPARRPY